MSQDERIVWFKNQLKSLNIRCCGGVQIFTLRQSSKRSNIFRKIINPIREKHLIQDRYFPKWSRFFQRFYKVSDMKHLQNIEAGIRSKIVIRAQNGLKNCNEKIKAFEWSTDQEMRKQSDYLVNQLTLKAQELETWTNNHKQNGT
jgi:capsule polysaccharide export protein KpsE/RkpR